MSCSDAKEKSRKVLGDTSETLRGVLDWKNLTFSLPRQAGDNPLDAFQKPTEEQLSAHFMPRSENTNTLH